MNPPTSVQPKRSGLPAPADRAKISFELTTKGKAALAWEDRVKPRISSKRGEGESGIFVSVSHGVDIEPEQPKEYEDGVLVVVSPWPYSSDLFLSIQWQHEFARVGTEGHMTVAQLDELIELLTAARAEAVKVGLIKWKPRPKDGEGEPGSVDWLAPPKEPPEEKLPF